MSTRPHASRHVAMFRIAMAPLSDAELSEERAAALTLAEAYRVQGDTGRASQALRDALLLGGILLSRRRSATALVAAMTEPVQ